MKARFVAVLLVFVVGAVVIAPAQTQTVYNNIPKPLPGNVASEGPEAYGFKELGDGLILNTASGTIGQVTVIMSSWACQSGSWYDGNCTSAAGATFGQDITINLYSVTDPNIFPPQPLLPLGSITQSFNVPYRPSADANHCPTTPTKWFNSKDKLCYNGMAFPIVVNFSGQHIAIPANKRIIVTVAFNTTSAGPYPIGDAACRTASGGCPYDSLNISTDSRLVASPLVGGLVDGDGVFVNYTWGATGNSCSGAAPVGVLADDTGCWLDYHPLIQVQANTNSAGNKKGLTP